MRFLFPLLIFFAGAPLLPAQNQNVLIIGDSLSKGYAFEGPGIGVDPFPPPSPYPQNWCEILHDLRRANFDFGDSDVYSDERLLGHEYNWSIPGSYAEEWHNNYLADPPSELADQMDRPDVKRIVVWLGGNDVRENYGPIYNGEIAPEVWAAQTYEHLAFVVEWVLARRLPGTQMVLVNVTHLGGTIAKNRDFPFDPVRTGRVTAALDDLNARLSALAHTRGIGLADIYRMTKELMLQQQISIGGWIVRKRASGDADTDAMFLDDGFHPNMPVQAVFAQTILDTFNDRYQTAIPRLTNREIVEECLEENPNVSFNQWVTSYGIAAADQGVLADPDGDGVPNIVEFGLDLDPAHKDSNILPQPRLAIQSGQAFLALSWQPRDPANTTFCEVIPQQSSDLVTWTDIPAGSIVSGELNTKTVSVSAGAGKSVWLRFKVRLPGP